MNHFFECACWAALCFQPSGVEVYDPVHAQHYRVEKHYRNELWCNITYGIDCKVTGPGEDFDWIVVKYTKDPFNALRKFPREVTHHNKFGVAVENDP